MPKGGPVFAMCLSIAERNGVHGHERKDEFKTRNGSPDDRIGRGFTGRFIDHTTDERHARCGARENGGRIQNAGITEIVEREIGRFREISEIRETLDGRGSP